MIKVSKQYSPWNISRGFIRIIYCMIYRDNGISAWTVKRFDSVIKSVEEHQQQDSTFDFNFKHGSRVRNGIVKSRWAASSVRLVTKKRSIGNSRDEHFFFFFEYSCHKYTKWFCLRARPACSYVCLPLALIRFVKVLEIDFRSQTNYCYYYWNSMFSSI